MRLNLVHIVIALTVVVPRASAQDLSLVQRIGVVEGDPNYIFARPGGVRELTDGLILVLEGSDSQFRIYSADGSYVRAFGGRGGGPGEFMTPTGIIKRDSVLEISDPTLRRVTRYTISGRYVDDRAMPDWPITGYSSLNPLRYGYALTASNPRFGSSGVDLDIAVQLLREDNPSVDTLLVYRSDLVLYRYDARNLFPAAARVGSAGAWSASGDTLVVTLNAERGIVIWSWVDRTGLREWRRSNLRWSPDRITDSDREDLERLIRDTQRTVPNGPLEMVVPQTWGRVGRMIIANDGTAWINLTDRFQTTNNWLLVPPGSTETTRVTLPERMTLHSVTDDLLYGIERDANDVPFVAVYRMHRD